MYYNGNINLQILLLQILQSRSLSVPRDDKEIHVRSCTFSLTRLNEKKLTDSFLLLLLSLTMALQLNKSARGRNLKVAAGAGAVVLGAGYLLLSTFPHLKTSIYNYVTNTQEEASDDNEPIELSRSDVQQAEKEEEEALSQTVVGDSSLVDINEWSQDNLKHWLSQVCILLY